MSQGPVRSIRRAAARLGVLAGALLALAAPHPAEAYDRATHRILTGRAWPDGLAPAAAAAGPEDAAALRAAVWEAGASHADPAVRAGFLARWPEAAGFDAWALKALLGLTPEARVSGLDLPPPVPPGLAQGSSLPAAALAALASSEPDDDGRNQERFAHDRDRAVRHDGWGRPLPADPAQLEMGSLTGLSSQAWAHYALPRLRFSDDPKVLEVEPRRFAVPPTVHTVAAESAQDETDLALAAATLPTPGARALALSLLGNAEHYLEDAANQIHTIQAVYPFFVSAKLEEVKEDLLSLGGLLGPRRGFLPIGIQIISNHHLFTEALWSSRLTQAAAGRPASEAGQAGLEAIATGDQALEATLDGLALGPDGPFAGAIVTALADASSREGAEVYLAARAVGRPRLSSAAYLFQDGADPEGDLSADAAPGDLQRFMELQCHGMARAGSAVRRHVRLAHAAMAGLGDEAAREALRRTVLTRLVASRLAALAEGEARLAAWHPRPPPQSTVDWRWPAGALGLLLAAGWGLRALLRRRRASR